MIIAIFPWVDKLIWSFEADMITVIILTDGVDVVNVKDTKQDQPY